MMKMNNEVKVLLEENLRSVEGKDGIIYKTGNNVQITETVLVIDGVLISELEFKIKKKDYKKLDYSDIVSFIDVIEGINEDDFVAYMKDKYSELEFYKKKVCNYIEENEGLDGKEDELKMCYEEIEKINEILNEDVIREFYKGFLNGENVQLNLMFEMRGYNASVRKTFVDNSLNEMFLSRSIENRIQKLNTIVKLNERDIILGRESENVIRSFNSFKEEKVAV